MALKVLNSVSRTSMPFVVRVGCVLITSFCVGFTLSYGGYLIFGTKWALDRVAMGEGDLRFTVNSRLWDGDMDNRQRKELLESCISSGLSMIEVTENRLPYSVFRSKNLMQDVGNVKSNFYAVKERYK